MLGSVNDERLQNAANRRLERSDFSEVAARRESASLLLQRRQVDTHGALNFDLGFALGHARRIGCHVSRQIGVALCPGNRFRHRRLDARLRLGPRSILRRAGRIRLDLACSLLIRARLVDLALAICLLVFDPVVRVDFAADTRAVDRGIARVDLRTGLHVADLALGLTALVPEVGLRRCVLHTCGRTRLRAAVDIGLNASCRFAMRFDGAGRRIGLALHVADLALRIDARVDVRAPDDLRARVARDACACGSVGRDRCIGGNRVRASAPSALETRLALNVGRHLVRLRIDADASNTTARRADAASSTCRSTRVETDGRLT